MALKCYGSFLHTVIAGWDDKELSKVFEAIAGNTLMLKNLDNIVKAKPGRWDRCSMRVPWINCEGLWQARTSSSTNGMYLGNPTRGPGLYVDLCVGLSCGTRSRVEALGGSLTTLQWTGAVGVSRAL